MAFVDSLISVDWLADNIARPGVRLLDATWIMPGENPDLPQGYIPGAQFFDIDQVADTASPFKHTLPPEATFVRAMTEMGISSDDHVIIYDRHGVRTAPRLWWTFRVFGHKKISILDGGLPAWIAAGHDVDNEAGAPAPSGEYAVNPALFGAVSQADILAQLGRAPQILDARPKGRFYGTLPEPRAGLRSGHIPGSRSWPYSSLQTANGFFKSLPEIRAAIENLGIDKSKPIITTCGSGITAAGLAFALHLAGRDDVRVYDGSWTEWGSSDAPVSLED